MRNFIKATKRNTSAYFKKVSGQSKRVINSCLVLIFSLLSLSLDAQESEQDWWFNVEVLVFKRDILANNTEDFTQASFSEENIDANQVLLFNSIKQQLDLSVYLNSFPLCEQSDSALNTVPIDFSLLDIPVMVTSEWWELEYPLRHSYVDTPGNREEVGEIQQEQNGLDTLISVLDNDNNETASGENTLDSKSITFKEDGNKVNSFRNSLYLSKSITQSIEYQQRIPVIFDSLNKSKNESLVNYLARLSDTVYFQEELSPQHLDEINRTFSKDYSKNSNIVSKSPTAGVEQHSLHSALNKLNIATSLLNDLITKFNKLGTQSTSLGCKINEARVTYPNHIKTRLFASEPHFKQHIHMVHESELALQEYAQQIFKQRDIQPLLYTSWRDNIVFGIENAPYIRLVGGKLLTIDNANEQPTYQEWLEEYEIKEELKGISFRANNALEVDAIARETFFQDLERAIEENKHIDWLKLESVNEQYDNENHTSKQAFELDGIFKVYLEYVNQVPYLHIDSELKHVRLETDSFGTSRLAVYPFKQRRRIISKQIHYFDHPAFGVVVRLERFTPPKPINDEFSDIN